MKRNTVIIRVVLLAFIAVAVGYVFLRDRAPSSSTQGAPGNAAAPTVAGPSFIAYYFHATRRCRTCRAIEAQALETINSRFAEDLRQGRLKWEAVNLEDIGNDRYASDYGVTGSALVIAEVKGGRPVRFTKLEKVWDLVYQKPAFQDYVAAEVAGFMARR